MDPENLEVDRNDDDSQESDATSLSSVSYKENEDPTFEFHSGVFHVEYFTFSSSYVS